MLYLLLNIAFANILDNVFANFDAPYVHIPNDFHVVFGTQRTSSPNTITVDYSTKLASSHIILSIDKIGEIANAYVNLNTNKVYLNYYHSFPPEMKCSIFNAPNISNKLQVQSGNNAFILEPDVVFHLMSLYMGTGDDDLARFEISSLLQGKNKAYALFDKQGNLDSIEIDLESKRQIRFYVIEDLVEKKFSQDDFKVPWDCQESDVNLSEIIEKLMLFLK
ncbi:unnamed protein product [Paramecium sonneborni]|uniref:Uncharacterized protein n=1 Tax=Paramecium sonneborni TaxID=65129 RepID=A0A8S1RJI1_9CILI|nr:unnamed protein product [Paramecium sonneborni]